MVLTVFGCCAKVCLLITIVVVLSSLELGPPGDLGGTNISVGSTVFWTNISAALTTSKTCEKKRIIKLCKNTIPSSKCG